jgi:hypothetical protein
MPDAFTDNIDTLFNFAYFLKSHHRRNAGASECGYETRSTNEKFIFEQNIVFFLQIKALPDSRSPGAYLLGFSFDDEGRKIENKMHKNYNECCCLWQQKKHMQ